MFLHYPSCHISAISLLIRGLIRDELTKDWNKPATNAVKHVLAPETTNDDLLVMQQAIVFWCCDCRDLLVLDSILLISTEARRRILADTIV